MKRIIICLLFSVALTACEKSSDTTSSGGGSTGTTAIKGCMDVNAFNYDHNATEDCCCRYECDGVHSLRVGAVCNDGTTSTATGQGACSHHDGVKYWLCQ